MSLEKAIKHGKEKREQYRKSKAFDRTCRNHGSCPYCENNRTFQKRKNKLHTLEDIESYRENSNG